MDTVLAFDIGGTKIAWGVFSLKGKILRSDSVSTPSSHAEILEFTVGLIKKHRPLAVGAGVPGTVTANRREIIHCTNLAVLNSQPLADQIEQATKVPTQLDNDGRCALIGEVWMGAAQQYTNLVMLTLGTGLGGAVMQKGVVLPHPQDVNQEISRLPVDPTDVFPAPCGPGTAGAFLGGKNIERRFNISLKKLADQVREKDPEAKRIWKIISEYFARSVKVICSQYDCEAVLIGGVGVKDLDYYLQNQEMPCPVIPAKLGNKASLYGAARLALDLTDAPA